MTNVKEALDKFPKVFFNKGVYDDENIITWVTENRDTIRRALTLLEKHEQGYRMMPPEPKEETLEVLEELNNSTKYFYKAIFDDNLERLTRAQDDGVFYDE